MRDRDGANPAPAPRLDNMEVSRFFWASADRLILVYERTFRRAGIPILLSETRLASVNRDGKDFTLLVKPRPERNSRLNTPAYVPQIQDNIVSRLPNDPEHILLAVDANGSGQNEIRIINVKTGSSRKKMGGFAGIQNWRVDKDGRPRVGWGTDNQERFRMIIWQDGKFQSAKNVGWTDQFSLITMSNQDNVAYMQGINESGMRAIYLVNIETGELVEEVFSRADIEAGGIILHPNTNEPVGVTYNDGLSRSYYFKKNFRTIQKMLSKIMPGYSLGISGKVKGKHQYLIFAHSEQDPGGYYWFDYKEKEFALLAPAYDVLDPFYMAKTKAISFEARDGQIIEGFLTLPQGEKQKDLPTVILPHGGPYGIRSDAGWDYWSQFLASRGIAVLQPNFRGSGGYGASFERAGRKEWGGIMQHDVTDATHWMIKEGIADPDRICIMGGSYGGYAALIGPIMEPDLYRCAVSVNGVANIPALKKKDDYLLGSSYWLKYMGLKDAKDTKVSPFHRAEEFNIPLLIMGARDDARVDFGQTQAMHSKLTSLAKQSIMVESPTGGHTLDTGEARLTLLKAVDSFVAEHLLK